MNSSSPTPPRRSSWLRKILLLAGVLLVLLIVAFFVVSSSGFFKSVILPRAGKAVGGEITVTDASISPFSQVTLTGLSIKTTGTEPLLKAEQVKLRYRLFSILGGTLKVGEATIVAPVVQIVENADGTSNLDPLLKKESGTAARPAPASSKPPQVDLKNVSLQNATIRRVKKLKDGGQEAAELSAVNITLDQLKNGQSGKLTTAAAFKLNRPTNDVLEARSTGKIEFTLGADLMPQSVTGSMEKEITRAEGSLRELAGLRTLVTVNLTPTELKELSTRFVRADKTLGQVNVTGPLDLSKKEGRLKLEISSIDRQVLNLLGAMAGLDFGSTTIDGTTELAISQGGELLALNSRFNATRFSVARAGQVTPPMDLQLAGSASINTKSQTVEVQSLTLNGTQNQTPFLRGSLAKPMTLAMGASAAAAGDSAFDLNLSGFDLGPWKPFLGDAVTGGRLSLDLKVLTERGGKQLKFDVTSQIADLAAKLGSKPLTQAALAFKLNGQLNDFQKINLGELRLDLTQQGQPALNVAGAANYDVNAFTLQTQIEAVMARLTGSGPATPLKAGLKLDGTFAKQVCDLRQLLLTLSPTERAPKNELTITGNFDLSSPAVTKGRATLKSDTLDLTQLYDAFARDKSPASSTAASSPASGGNVEPEAVSLPLQMNADASFGRIFLHEIEIQNCQLTAKVDGGKITLNPCRLALNGAPVESRVDLNLGVKGYTYALSLVMDNVPLEPIANTFSPANRGQYKGLILANAKISGAGVTGASLQKSLSGQASFSFTNANLQLIGPKTKRLVVPIATLLRVPEITQSPLSWLDARMDLGGGNITLSRVAMQSAAFEAQTHGVIPIAVVLTNSPLNLPVEFALSRGLAEKASLLSANTPTNAPYAALPKFVTVKGTIGEPKTDLNELALGGMLLKSGVGIAEKLGANVDGKTGDSLRGIGNLLTGQKSVGSNQPGTNAAPKANPLDLFRRKP